MMIGLMPKAFDPNKFNRDMRAAKRKAEAAWKREVAKAEREVSREVDRVNRESQRRLKARNRKVEQQDKKAIGDYNRKIDAHNRNPNAHKARVIADLDRQLRTASSHPRYTEDELGLADRIQSSLPDADGREWDTFLSYARIDGADVATVLRDRLTDLGVTVWFDELAIAPGKSQALQMDKGLQKARAGIVLLTPAYVAGRFWTERELGALLGKDTLIPVLHKITFDEVAEYSGILPDLAGFETVCDSVELIAQKVAVAVLGDGPALSTAA